MQGLAGLLLVLTLLSIGVSSTPTEVKRRGMLTDTMGTLLPEIFPEGPDVKSIENATSDLVKTLNETMYETEAFDMNHSEVVNPSDEDPPDIAIGQPATSSYTTENQTESTSLASSTVSGTTITSSNVPSSVDALTTVKSVTESTVSSITVEGTHASSTTTVDATLNTENTASSTSDYVTNNSLLQSKESEVLGERAAESAMNTEKGEMPSSIIALVTAITFAVIAVFGYVSLIVWRRYLEYRYGNRELLVNDLEFDTNDLRHFEL